MAQRHGRKQTKILDGINFLLGGDQSLVTRRNPHSSAPLSQGEDPGHGFWLDWTILKGKKMRQAQLLALSKLSVQLMFVPVGEHTPRMMAALLHAAQLPQIFIPFKGNVFIYFHLLPFISCLQTVKYFE